jgi:hypothetical protein
MGNGVRDMRRKQEAASRKKGEGSGSAVHGATRSPKATGIEADILASALANKATGNPLTPRQQQALDEHEAPAREAAAEKAEAERLAREEAAARRKAKRDAKARKIAGNAFGTRQVSEGVLEDPAARSFAKRHNIFA